MHSPKTMTCFALTELLDINVCKHILMVIVGCSIYMPCGITLLHQYVFFNVENVKYKFGEEVGMRISTLCTNR